MQCSVFYSIFKCGIAGAFCLFQIINRLKYRPVLVYSTYTKTVPQNGILEFDMISSTHSLSITRQVTVSAAMTLAVLMSSLCKKQQ